MSECPLCGGPETAQYFADRRRQYLRCERCQLVYVPGQFHLSPEREKSEYDLHRNDPSDVGYRQFLSRLCEPLAARLASASTGLDFGCGPGPTLSVMLEEMGHQVRLYDIYYAADESVLQGSYDFITATEVVEHLRFPDRELLRLWHLLKPGGYLGIMTKLVRDQTAFSRWHYKNDPTHICFFSRPTWQWWAAERGAELEFIGDDVILLRRDSQ